MGSELTSPFYCFPITAGSWGVRLLCRKPIPPGSACTQEQGCALPPRKSNHASLQFAATRREESRAAALSRAALPRRSAAITSQPPPVSAWDPFEPETVHPRSIFSPKTKCQISGLAPMPGCAACKLWGSLTKGWWPAPSHRCHNHRHPDLPCRASLQAAGPSAAPPSPALPQDGSRGGALPGRRSAMA